MISSISKTILLFLITVVVSGTIVCGDEIRTINVTSPNGKNTISLVLPEGNDKRPPVFSVTRSDQTLIESSPLNIVLAQKGSLTEGAQLVRVQEDDFDETFMLPWGKTRSVRNHCSLTTLRFKSEQGILWDLYLRTYDDGVAFRYGLPEQDSLHDFVLSRETTEFRLANNPSVLFTTVPNFTTPHETLYEQKAYAKLPTETLIDMPFLAVWPNGVSAALTEAALFDFPGAYLERTPARESGLRLRLSPLPSRPEACAIGRTPHVSPWRVMFLADQAGKHIESNLLVCLNDPPQGDFSWVKPGKTTWHWWNGTAEKNMPFTYGMNFETHKYYIDFCARNGIAYHAIVADDKSWYQQSHAGFGPGPDTDITQPREGLELHRILDYAKQRGVGIRLWVHWAALDKRLEEAFTCYEAWGISGLMVDFLDRDDQEMVRFCRRVLESAARHKLTIQFHGSYKPSGEQRRFPNLENREGVLNLEYLKWSDKCTPQHNVNVAYTRSLTGLTDYHLGGFHSVSANTFKPQSLNPNVLGTRCHHLALYVVYDNLRPMVSDTPTAYEGQPGFEFLAQVPVTWDQTRFLTGQPGEFVVVARRNNNTWYLGGITNGTARKISVPLDMLGNGQYEITMFIDGSMDEESPNAIGREHRTITAETPLNVQMAVGGGFVATIRPKTRAD